MNTHAKKISPMKKLLVGILLVICLLYTGFTVIQMAVIILGLLFAGDGFGQLLAFFSTLSESGLVGLLVLIWPVLLVYLSLFLWKKYKSL
ncbi:MAG: hypothetical protein HOM90_10585 [Porticoccaceae bacterium]|jgi:hypothetical protein|nr:hypothetical protein [Porticoccaceae bacterium]MBT5004925.1 hypothetical protein [Porticoccaceae bacterium]MBT5102525.1 hypothetical protein [Porticoccaceae bacterium]MBT6693290.1 hypothetical protein [Porticoccaceae bacterium]MBT7167788.1 hypothetical protein [Porticoccaceae bacterium]